MGILFGEKLSPEELQRRLQKIRNPQLKQLVERVDSVRTELGDSPRITAIEERLVDNQRYLRQ